MFNQLFSEAVGTLTVVKMYLEQNEIQKAQEEIKKLEQDKFENIFAGEPSLRNLHAKLLRKITEKLAEEV